MKEVNRYFADISEYLGDPPDMEEVVLFSDYEAAEQRNAELVEVLRETSEYLDGSIRNSVWCDSILHKKMRAILRCKTCQGYGVIGWTSGQTPESFDMGERECPDCAKPTESGASE